MTLQGEPSVDMLTVDMDGSRILVVDDDADIRGLLSDFLEQHGFAVTAVADGAAMDRAIGAQDLRHALVADPKRPEEFAAMINMPLQYAWMRETLSVEGARFARRVFGWTGIARRTLQVFEHFKGRYDDLQADELEFE